LPVSAEWQRRCYRAKAFESPDFEFQKSGTATKKSSQ